MFFFLKWVPNKLFPHSLIAHILLNCFLIFESWEDFIHYECMLFVRYVISKCFPSVCLVYPLICVVPQSKCFSFFLTFNLSTLWIVLLGSCPGTLCLAYVFSLYLSISFKILDFAVRFMILFKLVFVLGVKYRSMCIFWHLDIKHHLLKRLYLHCFCTFTKSQLIIFACTYFWTLYFEYVFTFSHTALPWLPQLYSNSWSHTVLRPLCSFLSKLPWLF